MRVLDASGRGWAFASQACFGAVQGFAAVRCRGESSTQRLPHKACVMSLACKTVQEKIVVSAVHGDWRIERLSWCQVIAMASAASPTLMRQTNLSVDVRRFSTRHECLIHPFKRAPWILQVGVTHACI